MARYVDGYLLPIPKKNIKAYQKVAAKGAKLWKEHGALQYCECVGEELKASFGVPFTKPLKAKAGETVVFAFVVFKSRAHRDKVNKAVMSDPRLMSICDPKKMPFDCKRMVYSGFETLVDA